MADKTDDEKPSLLDTAQRQVAEAAARAAVDRVAERIGDFAEETLGALERAVFGDGAAVKEAEKDPLERARARYGLAENAPAVGETVAEQAVEPAKPPPPAVSAREAAEAKAREQLAELKRKMGKSGT